MPLPRPINAKKANEATYSPSILSPCPSPSPSGGLVVPAHLLQANRQSEWEPYRPVETPEFLGGNLRSESQYPDERGAGVTRASTVNFGRLYRTDSQIQRPEPSNRQRHSRPLTRSFSAAASTADLSSLHTPLTPPTWSNATTRQGTRRNSLDFRSATPSTISSNTNPFDDQYEDYLSLASSHTQCGRRYSFADDSGNPFDDEGAVTGDHSSLKRKHTAKSSTKTRKGPIGKSIDLVRRGSMHEVYDKAKAKGEKIQRSKWGQVLFEYGIYAFLICFIYFVLVGIPLWRGAVWWLYWVVGNKFVITGGFSITIGLAAFYAFAPLLIFFEKDPEVVAGDPEKGPVQKPTDTALLIPCYKSASLIAATLEAALKIFPASSIYVIANGNSPTPLDNTEEVVAPYGVNHIWSHVGSKIVAQFVGAYAAKDYKNILLIDDDCLLPPNFPVVDERLTGRTMCIGYTIKSVGPESSRGTLCQQAQDIEYKLSGLQRALAGKIGSATFPHGAISLWDRKLLIKTFHKHPGFSVSEDWFFGHVARQLGSRIKMCTSVFVETETPPAVIFSSGGARGGFGEMTIFKQRFKRWNFFFVNGMYYNMAYILGSWKLGFWEIGAKIFVFQEVYETLLYLFTPFILPISFYVRPSFCGYLLAGTVVMYIVNFSIFNEIHLRRKGERVGSVAAYIYYMPYKLLLTFINVASCYYSLWKYARYFARRHPKVIEDASAVEVVLKLEERKKPRQSAEEGRNLVVKAVETRPSVDFQASGALQRGATVKKSSSILRNGSILRKQSTRPRHNPLRRPSDPVANAGIQFSAPIMVPSSRTSLSSSDDDEDRIQPVQQQGHAHAPNGYQPAQMQTTLGDNAVTTHDFAAVPVLAVEGRPQSTFSDDVHAEWQRRSWD